jgi:hypothetical protein
MPFTGDLENLHIVDIIQLIHATRKSGTISVKGIQGESRIIFCKGYIVAANHLNSSVRVGSVLVKINAITLPDLEQALEAQKNAGRDRKPLIATLMELGKLSQEQAFKGLKKLIEITIVDLIGWTSGEFTFDTEAIAVSPECKYLPGQIEQDVSVDAQMVLMDALRIFDERERDRSLGRNVPPYEEAFAEVIPSEVAAEKGVKSSVITAEDLGLECLDKLEKKVRQSFSVEEILDRLEIHRRHIREILADFSEREQEAFVSFLEKSTKRSGNQDRPERQAGQSKALILFSRDSLIRHSVMTMYKNEGVLVFATDEEEELDAIVAQCLSKRILPILVFDYPEKKSGKGIPEEKIVMLRTQVRENYPEASIIQLASPLDHAFSDQSFEGGFRAVLPKPSREVQKETFIEDTIQFLETFKSYVKGF